MPLHQSKAVVTAALSHSLFVACCVFVVDVDVLFGSSQQQQLTDPFGQVVACTHRGLGLMDPFSPVFLTAVV